MTIEFLRKLVVKAANEDAKGDLAFSGNDVINKLPITEDEKEKLRQGLVYYAETAATRTLLLLKLHNVVIHDKAKR